MRVFTAGFGTETNTFSPLYIGLEDFRETCLFPPETHPAELTEVSAPLFVLRERARTRGWTVVEGTWAFAMPGGRVGRAAHEAIRDEILGQLRAALPVDFVAFALHGAMAAVGEDDCEGDLLARARAIVGPGVPIGAEIDPHAHLSEAMISAAGVIVAMKEYPHTDFRERAEELVDLLEAAAEGRISLTSAIWDCRMINRFHTFRQPMRGVVDRLRAMESEVPGLLSVSLIHGFPLGDVPDMGVKVLAITDGDPALAHRVAAEVGAEIEAIRHDTYIPPIPIDAALAVALASPPGPVVIADVGDNPGGGAGGDSTILLRAALATGASGCLGPLWDPLAVRIAMAAGPGARITLRIGGKTGAAAGEPLDAEGTVGAVSVSAWQSWAGTRTALGAACAFRVGEIDVILTSVRDQAFGQDLFTNLDVDPSTRRLVMVKSAQHFVEGFRTLTPTIVLAGGGGPLETDFRKIDYRRISRPKWPLDPAT